MMCFRILRHCQCRKTNVLSYKYVVQAFCSDSDSEVKKEKEPVPMKVSNKKSEEALAKLNLLLKQMVHDDQQPTSKSLINIARPKGRTSSANSDTASGNESTDVIQAAKDVAKSIGGDVKQTELELLSKLLIPTTNDKNDSQAKTPLNLSDVLAGMKIDRSVQPNTTSEMSRAHQVRQLLDRGEVRQGNNAAIKSKDGARRKPTTQAVSRIKIEPIDLFGGKSLGIFTNNLNKLVSEEQKTLKTWDRLMKRDLELAVTHPPQNYFQEMVLWTKQGKLWKFPVDNECGLDEEHNVYFAEHIFLDKHLEPWCPPRGPIRHFMELVCVGLSKNPYLTAHAKRDHINWYKEYFKSKEQLLQEVGALPGGDISEKNV